MIITLVADMSKSSSGHKVAAAAAKPLMKHVLKKAPSGAHALVEQDIKAGPYTVEQTENAKGETQFVLTPGVEP